ncbi:hypothetical protein GGX14DRAFT_587526 [Mycena pura]|uniref:F-box domain-containing protein n=1 Tax=Mycena pura TaxID=153505 RepID=A0AAD6UW04_9AGAR|nr:hypothetical protein GGX14DRAFT_587526 [Mycena pura]
MSRSRADRERIAELDAKILKLERSLHALRSERATIWERLDTFPVLTIPNEITSEIFLNFIPAYPGCPLIFGIDSPSQLMRVCRQWRDIALNTPQLWRAIEIDLDDERCVRAAKTWLVRSGSCPLSIRIDGFVDDFNKEAVEVILSHRSRWEYFVIDIPLAWDSCFLPDIASYPLLRQLDIRFDNADTTSPAFTFSDAPSLRTATLGEATYPSGFLPWHQLTSLSLVFQTPAECTDILKETINLIHCRLIISPYRDSDGELGVGMNLPHLESLALEHFRNLQVRTACTITTFVVPSLRRLRIADAFIRPNPVGKLSSLIAKSGCKLQELCIVGDLSTTENAYREALPSILNLSFDSAIDTVL